MDRVKVGAAICRNSEKTLVFVRTKRGADRLVEQLRKEGVKAGAIHGDLRQANRERTLEGLRDGQASGAGGHRRGRPRARHRQVDVVIHFDPPEDHKAYLHRSGRTARAGEAGLVVTLVQWNQILEVERIQTRIGLKLPIVEIFSNDPRLADLADVARPTPAAGPQERPVWRHQTGPTPTVAVDVAGIEGDRADPGGHRAPRRRRLRRGRLGRGLDRRRRSSVAYCIVTDGDAGGSDLSIGATRWP